MCETINTYAPYSTYQFDLPKSNLFYRIYLVNLKRRQERLNRMQKIFDILGIEYSLLEATDGQKLDELPEELKNYQILEGYLDPISKRPMKNGEIGCFLSHYRWERTTYVTIENVKKCFKVLKFLIDALCFVFMKHELF